MANFGNYSTLPDKSANEPIEVKTSSGQKTPPPIPPMPKLPRRMPRRFQPSFVVAAIAFLLAVLVIGGVIGFVVGVIYGGDEPSDGTVVVEKGVPVNNSDMVVPYETLVQQALVESFDTIVDITAAENKADTTPARGSGVLYAKSDSYYYILTNNHVIDGAGYILATIPVPPLAGEESAEEISVTLEMKVKGYDVDTDLAVLRFEKAKWRSALRSIGIDPTGREPKLAKVGNQAAIQRGAFVLAIGNALGELSRSITWGVISAPTRDIDFSDGTSLELLQHDAAVNPGNSGGGLFDANGMLIGIVNAKSTGSDVDGIGYAIPVGTFEDIAAQLIEHGYVKGRVQLGITLLSIGSSFDLANIEQEFPGISQHVREAGLYVGETSTVSGNLVFGDRIMGIRKQSDSEYTAITSMGDLRRFLGTCQVGDVVKVKVVYGKYESDNSGIFLTSSHERTVVLTEKTAPVL